MKNTEDLIGFLEHLKQIGRTKIEIDSVLTNLNKIKKGDILRKIDYPKLKKQKIAVLQLGEQFDNDSMNGEALGGIVNLIDSIQDYAVEVLGRSEEEIFNLEEN
tara:strand:- start:65 stop:376 length:312 start_codon:yes stop_codon:yes gene_type:complete